MQAFGNFQTDVAGADDNDALRPSPSASLMRMASSRSMIVKTLVEICARDVGQLLA